MAGWPKISSKELSIKVQWFYWWSWKTDHALEGLLKLDGN